MKTAYLVVVKHDDTANAKELAVGLKVAAVTRVGVEDAVVGAIHPDKVDFNDEAQYQEWRTKVAFLHLLLEDHIKLIGDNRWRQLALDKLREVDFWTQEGRP